MNSIRFRATRKQFEQLMREAKKQIGQKRYGLNGEEIKEEKI